MGVVKLPEKCSNCCCSATRQVLAGTGRFEDCCASEKCEQALRAAEDGVFRHFRDTHEHAQTA